MPTQDAEWEVCLHNLCRLLDLAHTSVKAFWGQEWGVVWDTQHIYYECMPEKKSVGVSEAKQLDK